MSPIGALKSENFGKFLIVRLRCSLFLAKAFTCRIPNQLVFKRSSNNCRIRSASISFVSEITQTKGLECGANH